MDWMRLPLFSHGAGVGFSKDLSKVKTILANEVIIAGSGWPYWAS